MEGRDMETSDIEDLPISATLSQATITGRSFAASGLFGSLCQHLVGYGALDLSAKVGPIDEKNIRSCFRMIVHWYRYSGSPGFWWSNDKFMEWLASCEPTKDDQHYFLYAALLFCIDRAVACSAHDRDDEAGHWFDNADWLRIMSWTNSKGLLDTSSAFGRRGAQARHGPTYALRSDIIQYWRDNIDSNLSAEKAAGKLTEVFEKPEFRTIASYISKEKRAIRSAGKL